MLSPEQLARMIYEEGLRTGMSQSWFDQNFGPGSQFGDRYGWAVYVPGPTGTPVLSDAYTEQFYPVTASTPPPEMNCPVPSIQTFYGGSWVCMMPDGSLITTPEDEGEGYPAVPVVPSPTAPVGTGGQRPGQLQPNAALPAFVGGQLGLVISQDGPSPGMDAVTLNIPELGFVSPFAGSQHHRRGRGGRRWR